MSLISRSFERELLDRDVHDPLMLRRGLAQIEHVNRWLGGARVILTHLREMLPSSQVVTLADCGTGSGDIPRRIVRWCRHRGHDPLVFAIDRQRQMAQYAREACQYVRGIEVVVADGLALPLGERSVDVAIASMTLHHLSDEDAVLFVREMSRVARCGILIADLERHPINHIGAQLLARTLWVRSPYRFDGPASVRRSFNARELLTIGREAQLQSPSVRRHFPYRLVLTGFAP